MVLQAEDLDTPPDQVFYILKVEPGFGNLLLKVGAALRVVVRAGPAEPSGPACSAGLLVLLLNLLVLW